MWSKKRKTTFAFTLYGGDTTDLVLNGSPFDIVTAVSICVSATYEDIMKQSPAGAKAFKFILQKAIADNNSPIWDIDTADAEEE